MKFTRENQAAKYVIAHHHRRCPIWKYASLFSPNIIGPNFEWLFTHEILLVQVQMQHEG